MAPEILQRALNGRLPRDIRVVVAERASARFHARFSARRKIYRYRIGNAALHGPFEQHYTWHVPAALDVEAMDAAARQLEGKHDFAAFQTTGGATRTTVRTMFRSRVARVEPSAGLPGHELCGAELVIYEIAGRDRTRALAARSDAGHPRRARSESGRSDGARRGAVPRRRRVRGLIMSTCR
jgi:tRNA pseudouridine(38-40) synthase